MTRPINIAGRRFGRLVALERIGHTAHGHAAWKCRCDCGTEIVASRGNLRAGTTRSCGCLKREVTGARSRTHAMSDTPTWNSWRAMVERCTNPNNIGFRLYGAKGITVHPPWRFFANFLRDVGERPDGMSLDRIDGSRGYEPGNVRWADMRRQQRNRANNRIIEHDGTSKPLSEWSEITGIGRTTIDRRLTRGWTVHEALTTPVRGR